MITLRPGNERGHANHGWLDSYHTFSFAGYHDPRHMGVSALRVINDDKIQGGQGFGAHPHHHMEIVTYVLQGTLEHQDNTGARAQLQTGEIQVMHAGTGIVHSEYNASQTDLLHLLQIWLLPNTKAVQPGHAQKSFADQIGATRIVSPDGQDGSLKIHQDASIWQLKFDGETRDVQHALNRDRTYYLHVATGELTLNGTRMQAGDGATLENETLAHVQADGPTQALLFDLP